MYQFKLVAIRSIRASSVQISMKFTQVASSMYALQSNLEVNRASILTQIEID